MATSCGCWISISACAACSGPAPDVANLPHVNVGSVPLGLYAGTGASSQIARFATRTGTKPSLGSDYLPRTDGWAGMVTARSLGRVLNRWHASGLRLVLGVPMIPTRNGLASAP